MYVQNEPTRFDEQLREEGTSVRPVVYLVLCKKTEKLLYFLSTMSVSKPESFYCSLI